MPKVKKKSIAAKQRENRERLRQLRKNPDFRTAEKAKDAKAHRQTRQNPDYRTTENERNAEAHRKLRENPEFRTPEKARDAEAHRQSRQNPDYRTTENERNAEAHRKLRQNPDFRTPEKARDAEAHCQSRQNPDYRTTENERNAKAHRKLRQNPDYRTTENERNAETIRKSRENPDFRTPEKARDAEVHRQSRQNPDYRTTENERNAEAHRKSRENADFRTPEKARDAEAHRQLRHNSEYRTPEKARDAERFRNNKITIMSNYASLLKQFQERIRCAPSFICSCCGGLFYPESTSITSKDILKTRGCTDDFINAVLHVSQEIHRLCSTCKISVRKIVIPRLALSNGFDFPEIPEVLKNLSPLEERLVSLRIPFMQIRLLGSERQSSLKGNVVNVENDLNVCAQVLPRLFDETSTVQVQLMRRISYKSPYMYETIRPQKVYNAAKYLVESELYKSENVVLCDDWKLYDNDTTMNFICSGNDIAQNESDSEIPVDNIETSEETYEEIQSGSDETLVFREDQALQGIRIAPGEGKIPIPLYQDVNAEVLSFPSIYGGFERKFNSKLKITYTDIAKSELRRYDRRACKPTKLLYSFKRSFNEKLYQSVQVCMRKKVGKNHITAKNVRTTGFIENLLKKDDGYAVFKNLRSSPAYWKEKQKKVLAMVRQLGKCTLFITLSAAETKWTELLIMLMKIVKNKEITESEASLMTFEEIGELIRCDPVTCMRHFDHRFRAFLNLLIKPDAGIFSPYKVQDYFSRFEFQMRGSPHAHGLYWIQDAPVYIEGCTNSERACIAFVDKFITCERYEDGEMEKLIGYQLHKHSRTCEKKLKHGQKCRFGFPKPPLDCTIILEPLSKDEDSDVKKKATDLYAKLQNHLNELGRAFKENVNFEEFLVSLDTTRSDYITAIRSSIKRTTVVLKRSTNAIFINPYNRKLLEAWGANIDVQFILDTYSCAKYCVGYILKSDGGVSKLLQAATRDARNGNITITDKLKNFASLLINGSEISAQEAAGFLLGIANTACSRQDVFINTGLPEERIGFLKSKVELDKLDDDCEDVCTAGLIEHYCQRPTELENICLAEFASLYEFVKTKKESKKDSSSATSNDKRTLKLLDASGDLRERITRKIIRFRHYGKKEDPLNYSREQLMLFLPWRDEPRDLLSTDPISKAERFHERIMQNSKPFYWDRKIDETLTNIISELETEDFNVQEEVPEDQIEMDEYNKDYNIDVATGKSTKVQQFLPPRLFDTKEYSELMRTLNEKQRRIVFHVLHLFKTSEEPFHVFLSGGAGVGKSHALKAIVQSCLLFDSKRPSLSPDQICVLVSAPTGKAAFNVFGMTLHCLFKLPPTQYGGKLCNLEDSSVNSVRAKLHKTSLFIIDEISMVSVKQIYDIDQRLRQIYGTSADFGGKSIIVVGHLRQLPPVAGTYVFKPPNHLPLGDCVGNYLWKKFKLYELDEIMRQQGDYEFCKALNNMSEGCMDAEDISLIKTREITQTNVPPDEAIRLFQTNEECRSYNAEVHQKLKTVGALSTAIDTVQGSGNQGKKQELKEYAKSLTPQESDGLPYQTHLQVGGEYFVSTNVDVTDGLFNGSTGQLKMIEFGTLNGKERVPSRVWMDFRDSHIGVEKRKVTKRYQEEKQITMSWVPIDRQKKKLTKTGRFKGLELIRDQIPLVAANGMTITKSQGSSLPLVVVNLRSQRRKISRELLYVACSRATSLGGLYINGEFISPTSPVENDPVSIEMARLRTTTFEFSLKFLQDFDDGYVKIYFHNVQSFMAHIMDIQADQSAMASNILLLVEPQLKNTDSFILNEFTCIHRSNCNHQRNSEGALAFVKNNFPSDPNLITVYKHQGLSGHCIFLIYVVSAVTIIMAYKSPQYSSADFVVKVEQTLSIVNGKIIFVGDVNINLMNSEGHKLVKLLQRFQLQSKLSFIDPSTDGGTHIDICFSNIENLQAWFYESYYSYHKPICIVYPKHF